MFARIWLLPNQSTKPTFPRRIVHWPTSFPFPNRHPIQLACRLPSNNFSLLSSCLHSSLIRKLTKSFSPIFPQQCQWINCFLGTRKRASAWKKDSIDGYWCWMLSDYHFLQSFLCAQYSANQSRKAGKLTLFFSYLHNTFIFKVVYVAKRNIKKGDQVTDCYGIHHLYMKREERQEALKKGYVFECTCEACLKSFGTLAALPATLPPNIALKLGNTMSK